MNESDKNRLIFSYYDIRAAATELFYSIGDGSNLCESMCVKIHDLNNFICHSSDLFEDSAVSECSDYKRFYRILREWFQDLREHVKETNTRNSVVIERIERLRAVILRDEALFGYSEEEADEKSDEEAKPVPGSYFTQYDFTLSVSLGRMDDDM